MSGVIHGGRDDSILPGVVPFPADFAAIYRSRGYWLDQPLKDVWQDCCADFAERIAVVDRDAKVSYADLDHRATNLALNLLDLGIAPLDRLVVQLPNRIEFVYLYLALQKIGAIPVLALPAHRFLEISQFVQIAGAIGCVTIDKSKDFDFRVMTSRIAAQSNALRLRIVLGEAGQGDISLQTLLTRAPSTARDALERIFIDPAAPAVFLLSGGTTGVPKLIPRTHNDYAYNSRMVKSVCQVDSDSVLLNVLPISHNLPLACPGLQGFAFAGAKTVLSMDTSGTHIFSLIERHRVTHIHVVPALLIRWINDPAIGCFDLSSLLVIQSGGQRLQPEIRRTTELQIPNVRVQENFGMAEGVLMFVRLDDPEEVRLHTVGRPVCPDDEIRLVDDDDNEVPFGEVGEFCCRGPYTLRGYYGAPEHNAKAFTPDGYYRSGDLMRQHPSGNFMVEGRKKDLINRGGEKISAEEVENLILSHPSVMNAACIPVPDPALGERMCACLILKPGSALTLSELVDFLATKEMAKIKLPERLLILESFPLSSFGKVSKKELVAHAVEFGMQHLGATA